MTGIVLLLFACGSLPEPGSPSEVIAATAPRAPDASRAASTPPQSVPPPSASPSPTAAPVAAAPAPLVSGASAPPRVLADGPAIPASSLDLKLSAAPIPAGKCPARMVPLPDTAAPRLCIDAYENVAGGPLGASDQGAAFPDGSTTASSAGLPAYTPTTGISWYQAYAICQNNRKHLCTVAEWMYACDGVEGAEGTTAPWGDAPSASGRCALPEASGRPYLKALSPAGAWPACRNTQGVYDMLGNAWEWVDPGLRRPDGTPVAGKMGAGWYSGFDRASCRELPALEHDPSFWGSIGFRCCVLPAS